MTMIWPNLSILTFKGLKIPVDIDLNGFPWPINLPLLSGIGSMINELSDKTA